MAISRNSKIKELMECPEAVAVIDKHLPGMTTNPGTKAAYGMTLLALTKFPQTKCPAETAEAMFAELEALGI
jgi:hypothetical protein